MTETAYKAIRGEKDFLFRYFTSESKLSQPLHPQMFEQYLDVWLMVVVGIPANQGKQQILNFLDKKFGIVK